MESVTEPSAYLAALSEGHMARDSRVLNWKDRATRTPPQLKPNCCIQNGFYWDEAILYPAGAHWKDAPASMYWNGLIVRIIPSLEKSLSEVH